MLSGSSFSWDIEWFDNYCVERGSTTEQFYTVRERFGSRPCMPICAL